MKFFKLLPVFLYLYTMDIEVKAQHFEITSLSALEDSLEYIQNISDTENRTAHLNKFWDSLKVHKMIPYTNGTDAVFMYRSNSSVIWNGDFNRWGAEDNIQPQTISGIDLWLAKVINN